MSKILVLKNVQAHMHSNMINSFLKNRFENFFGQEWFSFHILFFKYSFYYIFINFLPLLNSWRPIPNDSLRCGFCTNEVI